MLQTAALDGCRATASAPSLDITTLELLHPYVHLLWGASCTSSLPLHAARVQQEYSTLWLVRVRFRRYLRLIVAVSLTTPCCRRWCLRSSCRGENFVRCTISRTLKSSLSTREFECQGARSSVLLLGAVVVATGSSCHRACSFI